MDTHLLTLAKTTKDAFVRIQTILSNIADRLLDLGNIVKGLNEQHISLEERVKKLERNV